MIQGMGQPPAHHHPPPTMATLTAPAPAPAAEAIADLDDIIDHPLCTATFTGVEVEDETTPRFQFEDAEGWEIAADGCSDSEVVEIGRLYIAAGRPFTLEIDEPFDEEAADREDAEWRQDQAMLWAAHGPGR